MSEDTEANSSDQNLSETNNDTTNLDDNQTSKIEEKRYCEMIGKGAYSIVFKITQGDSVHAKKVTQYDDEQTIHYISAMNETIILRCISHPNIVEYIGHRDNLNTIILDISYYPCNLHQLMVDGQLARLFYHSRDFIYQLLLALNYIHNNNIIHCDIKPANILADISGVKIRLKLCDFGLSSICDSENSMSEILGETCTITYRAPELFGLTEYMTPAIDIWSLGIIYFEIVNSEYVVYKYDTPDDVLLCYSKLLGTPRHSVVYSSIPHLYWPDISKHFTTHNCWPLSSCMTHKYNNKDSMKIYS